MHNTLTVSPLKSGEHAALKEIAASDGHGLLFPSHVMRNRGEIVGYASICSMPIFSAWFHSKKLNGYESCELFRQIDDHLRIKGHPTYAALCSKDSPLYPLATKHMDKLADFTLFERVF